MIPTISQILCDTCARPHSCKDKNVTKCEWYTQINFGDSVNHPTHYTSHPSGVECITITQHYNFCVGNAIKYLWRAGLKSQEATVQDLQKAIWYINKEIESLQKGEQKEK